MGKGSLGAGRKLTGFKEPYKVSVAGAQEARKRRGQVQGLAPARPAH